LVVVDDDANTRATFARTKLDLGPLDESGLSKRKSTVESCEGTLGNGCNFRGNDVCLARLKVVLLATQELGNILGLSCVSHQMVL
jgi:hypothetical protein